jgi:hypothetical protein
MPPPSKGFGNQDDQQSLLDYERFISEVLRRRGLSDTRGRGKGAWRLILESAGGAALITVLVGGVLGQWLSYSIQTRQKDREFQQSVMKMLGDQALISYSDYLHQEEEIVKRAYDLIGLCITAADDLVTSTTPEFAVKTRSATEQRLAIQRKYNVVDDQWRSERAKIDLLIMFYHRKHPEVVSQWDDVKSAVTNHMDSAHRWYQNHGNRPVNISDGWMAERKALGDKLGKFASSLEAARYYVWEQWQSPENVKAALDKYRQ